MAGIILSKYMFLGPVLKLTMCYLLSEPLLPVVFGNCKAGRLIFTTLATSSLATQSVFIFITLCDENLVTNGVDLLITFT